MDEETKSPDAERLLEWLSEPRFLDLFAQVMDAAVGADLSRLREEFVAARDEFSGISAVTFDAVGPALFERIEHARKERARDVLSRLVLPVLDCVERVRVLGQCVWQGTGRGAFAEEWRRRYGAPIARAVVSCRVRIEGDDLTICAYDESRLALLHEGVADDAVRVELFETRPIVQGTVTLGDASSAEATPATDGAP